MSGGNLVQLWGQAEETDPKVASSHSGCCFQISSQSTVKEEEVGLNDSAYILPHEIISSFKSVVAQCIQPCLVINPKIYYMVHV